MPKKLPYLIDYIGDYLRSDIAKTPWSAQGLLKRMKMIAHDSERYGYLQKDGKPMSPDHIALKADGTLDDYVALFPELVAALAFSFTSEQIIYFPEMVQQQEKREDAKGRKRRSRRKSVDVQSQVSHRDVTPNEYDIEIANAIEVPEDLKNDKESIFLWFSHRREIGKKYKGKTGINALWRQLRDIPPERRKQAIDHSMAAGWSGVFPPKGGPGGRVQIAGEAAPRANAYDN